MHLSRRRPWARGVGRDHQPAPHFFASSPRFTTPRRRIGRRRQSDRAQQRRTKKSDEEIAAHRVTWRRSHSAAISALDLWRHGARVTLVHRGPKMHSHVKYWILPDIENRLKNGDITAYFKTTVQEIAPDHVVLQTPDGDALFFSIGHHVFSFAYCPVTETNAKKIFEEEIKKAEEEMADEEPIVGLEELIDELTLEDPDVEDQE